MSYDSFCADVAKIYPIEGSLSEGAPPAPLGMKQRIPATATGFTHGFVVTATGALAGSARFDSSNAYDPAVHSSFGLGAQEGEQLWILVANPATGSVIERGMAVKWAAAADNENLFYIQAAGADDAVDCIGFAQFDIPVGKAAYVLAYGKGVALANSDVARADALALAGGGEVDNTAAATDSAVGKALKAESGGVYPRLTDIFALCRI